MGYLKSMIPITESNYDSFTTVERSIADFFIYNREETDFSAKAVAGKLFVSEVSLPRSAEKCESKEYGEFIYQYGEHFVVRQESMTGNTRTVLNAYQELLNKTYNLVNEKQVKRICRYMNRAAQMFVCSMRNSGLAARGVELRFMKIGVDIISVDDRGMICMRGVFQDENDLVLGVSISGETEDVILLLQETHQKKVRTTLLTTKDRPEYDGFCDGVLLIPSLLHLNRGNVISPQFPILLMTDIFYSCYVSQDRYEREILHNSTLKASGKTGRHDPVWQGQLETNLNLV